MARSSEKTRERIISAAEVLFAQEGYESVSLRTITTVGKANIAAVNYHFGTKEELLEKVMERHLLPILEGSLEHLRKVTETGGRGVEEVIRSFTQPIQEQAAVSGMDSLLFGKLWSRLLDEHHEAMPVAVKTMLKVFQDQWQTELEKRVKGLTKSEISWRVHAFYGAVYFCLREGDRAPLRDEAESEKVDLARKLEYLVAMAAGMFGGTTEGRPRVEKRTPVKAAKKSPAKKVKKVAKKKVAKKAATKRSPLPKSEGGQVEFGF